jgi:hypothetical protein
MDEKPIPTRIADIKSEITALGFGPRLTGLTEKTELISLLLEARSSLRKIPVVLLGERHNDSECTIENSLKLAKVMGLDGKSRMLTRGEFLLISEGRGVNPCYEALSLPRDRIIIEHSEGQSKVEMMDKLILMTDLLIGVVEGTVKRGTGSEAAIGIPDMVTIGEKFFMSRAKRDGYWPLLQTVPNGTDIYRQMVDAAFSRNESQFYSLYNNSILSYLIGSDYLNDVPMSDDIRRRVQSFIQTRDGVNLKQLSDLFRLSRDADIIRKVEERARSENSTLNVVVIIFGAIHYDNLTRLISASDVLNFDSTRSSNIEYGGRKTKNTKKRITKKYNSKSKHGKTLRNKRKNRKQQKKYNEKTSFLKS